MTKEMDIISAFSRDNHIVMFDTHVIQKLNLPHMYKYVKRYSIVPQAYSEFINTRKM